MDQIAAIGRMIDAIEGAGADYMIVGSLSTNAYGIPRSTKDADLVVEFRDLTVRDIVKRLDSSYRLDPQTRFETVTGTIRQIITVGDDGFIIELFHLSADAHDQERFRRRSRFFSHHLGREAYVATAEDAVIMKLRWAKHAERGKDTDDVRNVLAVQGDNLDYSYIRTWTDRHETTELLEKLLATVRSL